MASKKICFALFAAPLTAALIGITWGLPGSGKKDRVLPARWNSPVFFDALASGWQDIYDRSRGSTPLLAETDGKYSTLLVNAAKVDFTGALPPGKLHNSYRSMIIRSQHPDEALPLSDLAQMKPEELNFRPPSFLYGGGYLYPLGAYFLVLSKLTVLQRLSLRKTLENPDSLARIYTAGRFLSALAFAGICCLCFLTADKLAGPGAGALAFLFALTAPLPLVHAHFMTPHLWSAFWGLLSVFFLLRAMPSPGFRDMILSGIFLGASAGSYWSQLHVLVFLAAILLSPGRAFFRRGPLLRAGALACAGALTFLLLNPYILGGWKLALREMAPGPGPLHFTYRANLAALFTTAFPAALGLPCTLAIAGGCVHGLLSKNSVTRALAAACIAMFFLSAAVIPADFPAGVRRFFPWLMLSLVLAGIALNRLAGAMPRLLKIPLFLLCFLPGAVMSLAYGLNFARAASAGATFSRMGAELDALKPEGRLGLLEFPQPCSAPHFRLDRWPLLLVTPAELAGLADKDLPAYLLVTFQQKRGVLKVLEEKYALARGFYPERVLWFDIDPAIGPANGPIELYRLKEVRR